jgi:hypothetical protein
LDIINKLVDETKPVKPDIVSVGGVLDASIKAGNAFSDLDAKSRLEQKRLVESALGIDTGKAKDALVAEIAKADAILAAASNNQNIVREGVQLTSQNPIFLDTSNLEKALAIDADARKEALKKLQEERALRQAQELTQSIVNNSNAITNTTNMLKQVSSNQSEQVNNQTTTIESNTSNLSNITTAESNTRNLSNITTAESDISTAVMDYLKLANSITPENSQASSPANQILEGFTATSNQTNINNQDLRDMSRTQISPTSRVESKEIVSNSEYTKITKPTNPVVESVNLMNKEVGSKIEGVGQNIKTSLNNVSGGQTVNNSSASTFDQSSTYNTMNSETGQLKPNETPGVNQQVMAGGELSEFYLSSIYEMIASGIKVKISY